MLGRLITLLLRLKPCAKGIQVALLAPLLLLMTVPQAVADLPSARLDRGFLRLYDLDFTGAQKKFQAWEKLKPENPQTPARPPPGHFLYSFFPPPLPSTPSLLSPHDLS